MPDKPTEWTCPVCKCRHLATSQTPPSPWCEGNVRKHDRIYFDDEASR